MTGARHLLTIVLAVEEGGGGDAASGPEVFGVGSLVLLVAVAAVLGWMAYLYVNSRRTRDGAGQDTPQNLQPYVSDDELENRRTTRVLRAAVLSAGLLAIVLPWYAFNEPSRQEHAAEALAELDIEQGGEWYTAFFCITCHGASLGGGAAPFTEARSGIDTSWSVPSLDDVLYRYEEEEVLTWINYGRDGTPMPPNGLEGGGAMSEQEVQQVLAYIRANQIPQQDALAKTDTLVSLALNRMADGAAAVTDLIRIQEARIADVQAAKGKIAVVGGIPEAIEDLLAGDGTCTDRSAILVLRTCDRPGTDTDRDGIADAAEGELTAHAETALVTLPVLQENGMYVDNPAYGLSFDVERAFTNTTGDGSPIADLDAAGSFLETLEAGVLVTGVTAEREEQFLAGLVDGLAFLERAADEHLWEVDNAQVQQDMNAQQGEDWEYAVAATQEGAAAPEQFLVAGDDAERAVGLFNAYCSRCHTGGYSAGSAFETGHGTGAWGPSLIGGRSIAQYPNWLDQVAFVVEGTEFGVGYGVNGLGSGRMPGFGRVLTERDIRLIVMYERTL